MANNQVSVEITLEEKAALKALTQLTKEVQKTEDGFQKLGKSGDDSMGVLGNAAKGLTDGFGSLVKGVTIANLASEAIIGATNAVKDFVLGSVNAAIEQENAINRLNQALKVSGDFSKSASDEMVAFASSLQATSKYGDEVVIGQLAVAKSFGASNEKAKELVQAAANLAATFGGSLEERVQQLGKTLSGSAGRLAQFIPELKNLTEEQLKAAGATDIINSKFAGAAKNELNTYEGQVIAAKNALSDLQEELGAFVTTSDVAKGTVGFLSGMFQQLTKDLYAARVASKVQADGYTESRDELAILYEKQEQLNTQLVKYQQIANSKGLDLRSVQDAKANVESLKNELMALNSTIKISASAIQREEDKPAQPKTASAGVSPSDQKLIDSRAAAYEQLKISQVEFAAWEAEQDLLKREITSANYQAELDQLMGIEQAKIDAKFSAEEQKAQLIQDAQTKQLTLQKIAADKELAIDKSKVDAKKKLDTQMLNLEAQKQAVMAGFLSSGANLASAIAKDGSKEQFAIQKAASIAQAWIATNTAMTNALALPLPPPKPQILAAQYKAMGAMNIAAIAATAIKGFQDGGIVPGASYSGDNVMARVNSGEMILNRQQQAELFKIANGAETSGGGVVEAINRLANAIMNQPITLSVDGRALAHVIRGQVQSGFRIS